MFKDIIKNCNSITIIKDNKSFSGDNIKEVFLDTLEGSYFAPSFVTAEDSIISRAIKNGYWVKFEFEEERTFKDYSFNTLLINIKPKYNWLTFYRNLDGLYQGKCININLSTNTTKLYEYIKSLKD